MKQWDIYLYPFAKQQPHPVLIISNLEICKNERIEEVNALFCSSAGNKDIRPHQVVLDESDGLDWKTFVDCDFIYTLPKNEFERQRGHVASHPRRKQLAAKIAECFRFALYVR